MLELYVKNPMEIELRDIESLPTPKNDEVKIKLIYGGICGSDIGVFKGKLAHATYPLRPGHELIGTVIEAGEDAKYEAGTRVVVLPNTFCGECDLCIKGRTNICRHKKSLGININGGFSEECIISSKYVLSIPDDLPDKKAVLIEPFAVVVNAFKKVHITKDTSVAIIGSGNEGMLAAALAYYLGARVTAIDINPKKHDIIRSIGDIRAVYPQELKNESFDVVIEAAGAKNSVEQAIRLVSPGGAMVLIGLTPEANFPVTHMVRHELSIYGTIIYNFPHDYLQTIEYLNDPKLNIEPIVSMIVPLTQYKYAYETALSGDFGKVILDFQEGQRS
ncbi:zinc-dependent alcohol dehydrogenase [Priestia endophytica]|uniref:zinc-dependent alcohol dehydrogenase n=1 Tax=Priestia endophytica TaxID=135735 RepID=UPI000DCA3692|nr:alcohol dehydrogenase catalytic domain-containing protein [Priestia endophytica]RAS83651.1 sorbitol dehydrogenase [Priestia endophytica]